MKIQRNRLQGNLEALGNIGRNAEGGIDRAFGSKNDLLARQWLIEYWRRDLLLEPYADAVANLWLNRPGSRDLAPVVIGSHHDAVRNGGMFDGALGVLAATEVMQTLRDNGHITRHPLRLVSFTGEEPNPFNVSTLGSKVISGRLKQADLLPLRSGEDGTPLAEALKNAGGDIEKIDGALIAKGAVAAFLELHIEQGRRLKDMEKALCAVSQIIGIYREDIEVIGGANHAGTTVMRDRHDALLAAGEFALAFEQLVCDLQRDDVLGTIGKLDVLPNSANIIPGKVCMTLELRTCDPDIKRGIADALRGVSAGIEEKRGVRILRQLNLDQAPMAMDETVQAAVSRAIENIGEDPCRLVSMAGHDAANVARVAPAGMIFVQSPNGKSHCPEEFTSMDEIEKAANALLEAVLIIDEEFD